MKPLVWPVDGASVAASDATTVEDVLNGEIDVDALSLAGDLGREVANVSRNGNGETRHHPP